MLKYLVILLFFSISCAFGQDKEFEGDPDKTFAIARNLAFNKQTIQAQDTLLSILKKYPNYDDVRSFLASTYLWEANFKRAIEEYEYILKNDSKREDVWGGIIKCKLESKSPFDALEISNKALKELPSNKVILYLKSIAEYTLEQNEKALKTLDELLIIDANNEKAKSFKNEILSNLNYNIIGVSSSVDLYSEVFDPMQYYLLKYMRQTKYGSIHGKLNVSRRFASTGTQFEVDMYPKLTKGLYAYLNFGISNSFLYPSTRYGAELFKSLPKNLEASIGFRALTYNVNTYIYTGSMSWYFGNSYLSFRAYVTPWNSNTSSSGIITYRKYRKDAFNYLSVDVGMGFSPEVIRFDLQKNENEIINLQSQNLNIGYYFTSKSLTCRWGTSFGITHQENVTDQDSYFWIYSLKIIVDLKFR